MKNLTIIYKKGDFGSIANLKYILSAGAYLIRGDYALDATHTLNPEENALLIISTRKVPNGENPTKGKIRHTLVICSQGVFFDDVKVWSVEDGEITEPKLDTSLKTKVNNNVKTVAQTLTGSEIDIASMNLKFKDNYQNFFANRYSYESVAKLSVKPNYHIFGNSCTDNTFGTNCYYTTLGNNCRSNTFGNDCVHNILGDGCSYNIFGKSLECSKIDSGVTYIELRSNASIGRSLKNIHILSGIRGKSSTERLVINIPDEYLNSSRELIITTKRTDGGPSTPEDIVMYYADEVVDKQNKQDATLATSSKEVVGAINELFNGGVKDKSIELGKLAQAVQDTLGMVGMNVKEVKNGEDLFSLEDGIYALNGTSYKNYPIGIPFYASSVNILVVTHSNQKVTLYGVDGSHSSPILPLVAIGDLSNKIWRGQSFYDYFASNYEVGHKLDQKLDNTSSLTDTEVNNIWDNN